jgi:beta-glucanase (GH16 family)
MAVQTLLKLLSLASLVCHSTASVPSLAGYNLVWSDDFNGFANSPPNANYWEISKGPPNNGNSEWEIYTSSNANLRLSGSGSLLIVPEKTNGQWTSGKIEGRQSFTCDSGKKMVIEAQIRLGTNPTIHQKGIWPAFWALGSSFREGTAGWPSCGEWDVLEAINADGKGHGTLHCGTVQGGPCHEMAGLGSTTSLAAGVFHKWTFVVDRTESAWWQQSLTWYRDGAEYHRVSGADIGDFATWVKIAHSPFFLILNVAVGGMFPGPPNAATAGGVGSGMEVAYVAVWKQN